MGWLHTIYWILYEDEQLNIQADKLAVVRHSLKSEFHGK